MKKAEYEIKMNDLFNKWKKDRPEYVENFVEDGIIDFDKWESAKPKILFLLKEVNDDFEPTDPFTVRNNRFSFNIARWRYAIMELYKNINISPLFPENDELPSELFDISFIEIKKVSENKPVSDGDDLSSFAKRDANFIREEIEIINPEIILCCGTFEYLRDIIYKGELTDNHQIKYVYDERIDCSSWKMGNRMILYFYHPSYRNVSNEELYNILSKLIIDGGGFQMFKW